jgi:hypothetical protein
LSIGLRAPISESGRFSRNAEGSSRLSNAAEFPPSIMILADLGQRLSSLLIRGVCHFFFESPRCPFQNPRIRSGRDGPM